MEIITITNEIYMQPFSVKNHWTDYASLLEHNEQILNNVEMNQIIYYRTGKLLAMIERGIKQCAPNYAIYCKQQLIGRIWTLKTEYDDVNYDAIGIILDYEYVKKHIMSQVIPVFLDLCKNQYHIKTILWEAKSINNISNHLAEKYGFKLMKQIRIDPKSLHPHWNCEYYNLHIKNI